MAKSGPYRIEIYDSDQGSCPFLEWIQGLDVRSRARIQARIFRFEFGNLGDVKAIGGGVFEARLDFGPGYRIYFGLAAERLLVLLMGGDKASQRRDILKAKKYWFLWQEE